MSSEVDGRSRRGLSLCGEGVGAEWTMPLTGTIMGVMGLGEWSGDPGWSTGNLMGDDPYESKVGDPILCSDLTLVSPFCAYP